LLCGRECILCEACLRDEHKCFVRAFSKRFMEVPEIAEAEAWGVREALH
jgi:hypothetical protein